MIRYLAFCLCVAVAFGARARRQVACVEPMVNNVCQTGMNGPLHFPHPTDNNKFLQCAPGGRMFIIKCPANEVYHPESTSCGTVQPVVASTAKPQTPVVFNPCTAQNVAVGNIFFPFPGDNKKFIECSAQGQPLTLSCPTKLVYDSLKQGCILPTGSTQTGTGTGGSQTVTVTKSPQTGVVTSSPTGSGSGGNPCALAMTTGQELFFPVPSNPTRFFQCDLAGNAFIKQCPANLVWNQSISRCDTPYNLQQTQSVG